MDSRKRTALWPEANLKTQWPRRWRRAVRASCGPTWTPDGVCKSAWGLGADRRGGHALSPRFAGMKIRRRGHRRAPFLHVRSAPVDLDLIQRKPQLCRPFLAILFSECVLSSLALGKLLPGRCEETITLLLSLFRHGFASGQLVIQPMANLEPEIGSGVSRFGGESVQLGDCPTKNGFVHCAST